MSVCLLLDTVDVLFHVEWYIRQPALVRCSICYYPQHVLYAIIPNINITIIAYNMPITILISTFLNI
mgnify:CR=1 FL=1